MSETLWLIIYTAGTIGGFAGPVPYDMEECIRRRDDMRVTQQKGLEAGINVQTGEPMTDEERAGVASLSFECEYRSEKPVLGED